jgi:cation:H+ antiporter
VIEKKEREKATWWRRAWYALSDKEMEKAMGKLVIGVALLIFSADRLVWIAEGVANRLNLPMMLVGLILVAVGTSLPELSFEIAALKKREAEMALGNILGSVVANSTLILGITVILSPIVLSEGLQPYLVATLAFILIFGAFWVFVHSKNRLDRWEGVLLVLMYVVFILFESMKLINSYLLV